MDSHPGIVAYGNEESQKDRKSKYDYNNSHSRSSGSSFSSMVISIVIRILNIMASL